MDIKSIEDDIRSFVDDEDEFLIDREGNSMFTVGGNDYDIQISKNNEYGGFWVQFNGQKIPYITFLGKHLGKLELFAQRLVEKRPFNIPFVEGMARVISPRGQDRGPCLEKLSQEAKKPLIEGTKLIFVTADAGHGKSVLLRRIQYDFAQEYLKNKQNRIVWHVDLQGRELVRLNEALMYDLGELRITGLYFSSLVTLIKRGLLILAIDGFDELAAEIGGQEALGSLSSMVEQMENSGTLIAASRRTFFDTQEYIKRTHLISTSSSNICEFFEFQLENWRYDQAKDLIKNYYQDPEKVYSELLQELSNNMHHPLLTRPFLLARVVKSMHELDTSPSQFIGDSSRPLEGIGEIVSAFVKREVDKWKLREHDSGRPYLTYEQHVQLLSAVAEEMWELKSDVISIDDIQWIATILCEEWTISPLVKPKIVEMVRNHAFLIPARSKNNLRKFEHEEFKNFFLSKILEKYLKNRSTSSHDLKRFLYSSQLPDHVLLYTFNQNELEELDVADILSALEKMVKDEWKPTYLQSNIGTIIPFLIEGSKRKSYLSFSAKITYSSIVFENKIISNFRFENGTFVNISFRNTVLKNISFENCQFTEVRFHIDSENHFENVSFTKCRIESIQIFKEGLSEQSIFAPKRKKQKLINLGFKFSSAGVDNPRNLEVSFSQQAEDLRKAAIKVLNSFNSSTILYEHNIKEDGFWAVHRGIILETVIPLMEKHSILTLKTTKKSKSVNGNAWGLSNTSEEVLSADREDFQSITTVNNDYGEFWRVINSA